MTTFIVHMPASDAHRLQMFNPTTVELLPTPELSALRSDRDVAMVRSTFRTVVKMAKMFPDWQFQALIGA